MRFMMNLPITKNTKFALVFFGVTAFDPLTNNQNVNLKPDTPVVIRKDIPAPSYNKTNELH
jgi:hypothetical protein